MVLVSIHKFKADTEGEDLVPFETLKNPMLSKRTYRHYSDNTDVNPVVDAAFDEGAFIDDAWEEWKSSCGKTWADPTEEATRELFGRSATYKWKRTMKKIPDLLKPKHVKWI
jgi:hypothetical protein